VLLCAGGVYASLISNGNFDGGTVKNDFVTPGTQNTWRSDRADYAAPAGWYSSLVPSLTNGNYGEPISGYGSGNCAALKALGGNYYQQVLTGVDAGTAGSYIVSYDGGIRYHSSYTGPAGRTITLRISLWDVTADVELAGVDAVDTYSSSATSLQARSHTLVYNNTGLAGHTLALRFANTTVLEGSTTANNNQTLIDNVSLELTSAAGIVSPAPSGTENVAVDTLLEWEAPAAYIPTEYRVYFGATEPNVALADYGLLELTAGQHPYTGTSIDPSPSGNLQYDTTYYWVVDSYEPNSVAGGNDVRHRNSCWSFTTRQQEPIIDAQPLDQAAFPGEDVIFTVSATDPTGSGNMIYRWYYSADDVIDGTDSLLSSGTDPVLVVSVNGDTATAIADSQGYYYCVVDNGGISVTVPAHLLVKRSIAHYAFDGDAVDSSVQANNGVWPDPALETYNVSGQVVGSGSVVFAGTDPNSYINVGTDAAPRQEAGIGGINEGSVSCWIKTTSTENMSIYGTFNLGTTSAFRVNLNEGTIGRVQLYIRGDNGSVNMLDAVDEGVLDGQWHHIAFTWSASANTGHLYVDGAAIKTSAVKSLVVAEWQHPMVIGAVNSRGTVERHFVGELDELKLYNYPLALQAVMDQYLAGPADWICQTPPLYDWNGNCIVDLDDFATFALQWLTCGRYPQAECH
jgi:hypothetical protein